MTDAEITLEPEGLESATEALLKYERWTYGPTDLTAGSLHSTKAAIAIRAYLSRSTLPREGQGEVVALEWRELTSPREDGPPEPTGDVEAETMIGEYSVCLDEDEGVADTPWCCWSPVECIGHFADIAEAKAAAQGDFASRIRSALVFNETASDDTQAALPVTGETQALSPSPAVRDGVVTQELVADLVRDCERAMKQRDEALSDPTKRGPDGRTHDTTFEHILRQHLDPTYSYFKARALSTQEQGNG